MTYIVIDLETAGVEDGHALVPSHGWITSISGGTVGQSGPITAPWTLETPGGGCGQDAVDFHSKVKRGATIVGWNVAFDAAFLYATGIEIDKYKWLDLRLLVKWALNSVDRIPLSLSARVSADLCHLEGYAEYVAMKEAAPPPGEDAEYWLQRGKEDVEWTARLLQHYWGTLEGYLYAESNAVPDFARAQVWGLRIDTKVLNTLREELEAEKEAALGQLPDDVTEATLRSPLQLAALIFDRWGCLERKKTGRSVAQAVLARLAPDYPHVRRVIKWREANTTVTKFLDGADKALEYLGGNKIYPAARIASTVTGRMAYTSALGSKVPLCRCKVSLPIHQVPRGPAVRRAIRPPAGYQLVEFDAKGQEARFMAEFSRDPQLLKVFADGLDFHSKTGAVYGGMTYEEFMEAKARKDERVTGPHGLRNMGKLANLSLQYRMRSASLREKAFAAYGLTLSSNEAFALYTSYHRAYPGVMRYWKRAISFGAQHGYVVTLSGRKIRMPESARSGGYWKLNYAAQQNCINAPIQGSGADMKYIGMQVLRDKHPELVFSFDMHDGIYYFVPTTDARELAVAARQTLDSIDYPYYGGAGWEGITTPLIWDAKVGPNWGDMEEI